MLQIKITLLCATFVAFAPHSWFCDKQFHKGQIIYADYAITETLTLKDCFNICKNCTTDEEINTFFYSHSK